MKKNRLILALIFTLTQLLCFSQKNPSPAKPKILARPAVTHRATPATKQLPIKDTLAYYIQTTINELNAYITDNTEPVQSILGNYLGRDMFDRNSYSSVIRLPRSVQNTISLESVDRSKGIVAWEWRSILSSAVKNELSAVFFTTLKLKIDSIIKTMPSVKKSDEKNSIFNVSAYENVSDAQYRYMYKADEVGIKVSFFKPITQTEAQTIDSLVKIYRPGLHNAATANNAADKFTKELNYEGFSKERSEMIFADEVRVAADKDINAAFQMLLGTYLDQKNLMLKLTETQKSEIKRQAHEVVKAYNAKWDPVVPTNTDRGTGSSSFGSQQQNQQRQPEGKRVKCSVCNGVGQYEKVTYSHTYSGIYSDIKTNVTKWVICELCGGTGWVTKYKKN